MIYQIKKMFAPFFEHIPPQKNLNLSINLYTIISYLFCFTSKIWQSNLNKLNSFQSKIYSGRKKFTLLRIQDLKDYWDWNKND